LGNDNTATITGTNDWARATDGSNKHRHRHRQ